MITAAIAYISAGAFAAGLLLGGWVSYALLSPRAHAKGFEAGKADERQRGEEKMRTLTARLEADGLALQTKEANRVREINRIQDAAREAARVAGAEEMGEARLGIARVIARVRAAEAVARANRANRGDGVPSAAGAAPGTDGATCPGVLPDGRREALAGLNAEADVISAKYRVCLGLFRPPASPQ